LFQKEDGLIAGTGEEGELMVTGPTVMIGYWRQPVHGNQPYATGDIVRLEEDGNYQYLGRRDQMLKVRGYRIEPGDIEAVLELHPLIHAAAVVVTGSGLDARLIAFVVPISSPVPTLLEIKRFCAERLPRYMIVDVLSVLSELPHTRNGKIDRLVLMQSVQRNKG
jgi:acyl-coenzyme A synthetase/AMP-(fatty) acid ligase